jgi:hypothetical protein
VSSITVTPTAASALASITVNGVAVVSGTPSGSLPITIGNNVIDIAVTAENNINTTTYVINVSCGAFVIGSGITIGQGWALDDQNLSSPILIAAYGLNTSASIFFSLPSYTMGLPISRYVITSTAVGFTTSTVVAGSTTNTNVGLFGLTNGVTYTATMQAFNILETSPVSNIVSFTPNIRPTFTTATVVSTNTSVELTGVAVSTSGIWAAVGYSPISFAGYSTWSNNGNVWSSPVTFGNMSPTGMVYSPALNLFVSVGYNPTTSYPMYSASTDGITWSIPLNIQALSNSPMLAIAWSQTQNLFVAVGFNSNNYATYSYSSNGYIWSSVATMGGTTTVSLMNAVAVNTAGSWVSVGSNLTGLPIYSVSSNGTTWSAPAVMAGTSTATVMQSVVWASGLNLWVAVGWKDVSGVPGYPLVSTSTNGTTWSVPAPMGGSTTSSYMQSVTYTTAFSGVLAAVGYTYPSGVADYAVSFDGTNWVKPPQTISGITGGGLNAIIATSTGSFVAVGWNGSNLPVTTISNFS